MTTSKPTKQQTQADILKWMKKNSSKEHQFTRDEVWEALIKENHKNYDKLIVDRELCRMVELNFLKRTLIKKAKYYYESYAYTNPLNTPVNL